MWGAGLKMRARPAGRARDDLGGTLERSLIPEWPFVKPIGGTLGTDWLAGRWSAFAQFPRVALPVWPVALLRVPRPPGREVTSLAQ
jgi:hypothetical protein